MNSAVQYLGNKMLWNLSILWIAVSWQWGGELIIPCNLTSRAIIWLLHHHYRAIIWLLHRHYRLHYALAKVDVSTKEELGWDSVWFRHERWESAQDWDSLI